MPDNPDFAALEKNAPQFKPPQFDAKAKALIQGVLVAWQSGSQPALESIHLIVNESLQSAWLDGVITALKDRVNATNTDFRVRVLGPEDVKGGPVDETNPAGYGR